MKLVTGLTQRQGSRSSLSSVSSSQYASEQGTGRKKKLLTSLEDLHEFHEELPNNEEDCVFITAPETIDWSNMYF